MALFVSSEFNTHSFRIVRATDYVSKKLQSASFMALSVSSEFNTHSFRIVRATDMAAAGAADRHIMIAGR